MNDDNSNTKTSNLYQILEIEQNATVEIIRKSYKKLSLKYHPDKLIKTNLSEEEKTTQFIKIREAYEILSDSHKRKQYDRELITHEKLCTNFDDVIRDLKNILTSREYVIFMNILDNKIKQSLFNSVKIDNLLIKMNQMNLIDILQTINNFKILDIDIKLDFTLCELYNNKYQIVKYNRITGEAFEEQIYPIDKTQIYEREGEIIKIKNFDYCGNFIVHINIINMKHNDISYQILNNDLYASITKTKFLYNNILKIIYLDEKTHVIDINKIDTITTDFGLLYSIPNFGLPYYDTIDNVINIQECKILRGKLYLLII